MKKFTLPGRKLSGMLTVILIMALFAGCQKDISEPGASFVTGDGSAAFISGDVTNYMVITKSETLPAGLESKLAAYGDIVNTIPEIGIVVVKPKVSGFKTKVAKFTQVLAIVPDYNVRWLDPKEIDLETNPPSAGDDEGSFKYQWGLDAIDAPEAWNSGYMGEGAKVFILDNGISLQHRDLAPNILTDLCTSFVPDEGFNFTNLAFNHGTHVAGIIAAADNNFGMIGVAPKAGIVAVKVLRFSGSGSFSWLNEGLVYAAENGADIINMSLGATFKRNGYYLDGDGIWQPTSVTDIQFTILATQRAVDYAYKKGAVLVASAGNEGINHDGGGPTFKLPGGLQKVITVSATAPECWAVQVTPTNFVVNPDANLDIPASYTDYGKSLVELAAPGGDFDCAGPLWKYDMVYSCACFNNSNNYYAWAAGTSMAAPHVSGVAALIIGKNGGEMDPVAVTQQLLKTADKIDGQGVTPYLGYGRVNAYRAVTE